jgi:hypothetical protein
VAGLLIFLGIETENPVAGAVVDGGVLETLGAGHFDFFDVHLHTVPRSLATEVVIAFGDLQRRQFLGRYRRHAVPPSAGLRLYRSGGAYSQQDISEQPLCECKT